jgi:hypothetical protein
MHRATIVFAVEMDFESLGDIQAFAAMKQDVEESILAHVNPNDMHVSDIRVIETFHVVIPMPPCKEDRCCFNCRYVKAQAWQMPCLVCEDANQWEMPEK